MYGVSSYYAENGKFTLKSGKDRGIYVDNGAIFSMCGGNITENSNKENSDHDPQRLPRWRHISPGFGSNGGARYG